VAGLADQINSEPHSNGGRQRRIWQIMSMLDEEDQAALRAALDDFTVPAVSIKRALMKRNILLSETTISNYRNGAYGSL
jgi:hypothetical protein